MISEEELEELGLTQEEYEKKLKNFNQAVKQQITLKRRALLTHLRETFSININSTTIRRLSWTHTSLLGDANYLKAYQDLLKRIPQKQPYFLASDLQDKYHHVHFINAIFLSLLFPGVPHITTEASLGTCFVEEEEVESTRYENQLAFYSTLHSLIPRGEMEKKEGKKSTVEETLAEILRLLHEIKDDLQNKNPSGKPNDRKQSVRKGKH